MKIALINVPNNSSVSMNKDLVGGLGQTWNLGNSFFSQAISYVRKKTVNIPILTLAYLQAILKDKSIFTKYFESLPSEKFDLFLVYGSMIDFKNENLFVKRIKAKYPDSNVGFIGPFPSQYPELFNSDFIIIGEPESFFLYEFRENMPLSGNIKVKKLVNMDDLPTPDFTGFPIKDYNYFPALSSKPLLTLQASRGCPYSCSYYCAYGSYQGRLYRKRSPEKIFGDLMNLIKRYKIKSLQFRDPTFGLDKQQVRKLCSLIKNKGITLKWGIETRVDLLDKEIISEMFKAGLRNINIGIETSDSCVAELNKRKTAESKFQEEIISHCKKLGIKVSAFYIFGFEGDTEDSIAKTIDYSVKLNTNAARFAVSTPFPGTGYFENLKVAGKLKTMDFNKYDSFNLVFEHKNLTQNQIEKLKEKAYRKYYFRISYLSEFLKWRIREFWL